MADDAIATTADQFINNAENVNAVNAENVNERNRLFSTGEIDRDGPSAYSSTALFRIQSRFRTAAVVIRITSPRPAGGARLLAGNSPPLGVLTKVVDHVARGLCFAGHPLGPGTSENPMAEGERPHQPALHADSARVFRSVLGGRACRLVLPFVLVAIAMAFLLATPMPKAYPVVLLAFAIVLPVWLLQSTVYRIENATLTVRAPFNRRQVAIEDITRVSRNVRVQSPMDGLAVFNFALADNPIELALPGMRIYVSPRNEEEFLAAMSLRQRSLARD